MNGFYDSQFHGENIPGDAIRISDDLYTSLMEQHSAGLKIVQGSDGFPVAQEMSSNDRIKLQIINIEQQQTDRRIREAALGIDNGWLAALDAEIAQLRAQL